ncbi:MAG TPA: hypothetical protein VGP82_18705 [Ktedonobacterales bacterium]|nr:hypothetical protein [Ktedonobacterales bacterium]
MTEPTDQTSQTSAPAALPHSLLQDIVEFLEDGLLVFDVNGERVGAVKMYNTAAGYLLVGAGALGHKDLYIPFRLIRSIDPQGIALSEPKDALVARYAEPPAIHTMVEQRFAPPGPLGPDRDTMPQAYEVQAVQSGYDGALVTVDRVELANIAERLSVGLAVCDADGVWLGDIAEYDTERGLLTVEQGLFTPAVVLVPFSAICSIDRDELSVSLTLPRATLVQDQPTRRSI